MTTIPRRTTVNTVHIVSKNLRACKWVVDDDTFATSSRLKEYILSIFICLLFSLFFLKALKEHIMQVHQSLADAQASAALNGVAQHFSPPPTFSPGSFPFPLVAGANDNRSNSQSRSPNNNARAYACSYQQCGASFPTGELLDKHEMLQHSSGATSVVSTTFLLFALAFFLFVPFWTFMRDIHLRAILFYTFQQQLLHARYSRENEQACKKEATRWNPCHHL